MEMRCFRKILRISYKDHVTNEACNRLQQAMGPHDHLPTTGKKRKLKWYCHVSRPSGLAKTIWPRKDHLASQRPSGKVPLEGEEEEVDRRRGGKTTSKSEQGWSLPTPRGLWRQKKMERAGCKVVRGAPTILTAYGKTHTHTHTHTHAHAHTHTHTHIHTHARTHAQTQNRDDNSCI